MSENKKNRREREMHDDFRLQLSQNGAAYYPGETVTALLRISPNRGISHDLSNANGSKKSDLDVHLSEIRVQLGGMERVDTSWVDKRYREHVKPTNSDARRVQRFIVRGSLRAATQGSLQSQGEKGGGWYSESGVDEEERVFLLRFLLPEWLPPTFRGGMLVKYWYYIDVTVGYRLVCREGKSVEQREAHVKQNVHVWPWCGSANAAAALLGTLVVEENGEGNSNTINTRKQQLEQKKSSKNRMIRSSSREDYSKDDDSVASVGIKCWEVGSGTVIEDAIHHVETLDMDSKSSTPYSSTPQGHRLSRTTSLEKGGSSVVGHEGKSLHADIAEALMVKKKQGGLISVIPESKINDLEKIGGLDMKSPFEGYSGGDEKMYDGTQGAASFRLRLQDKELATIHLHPSSALLEEIVPGSTVMGTIEFNTSDEVKCLKYSVSLEFEEQIHERWRASGKSSATSGAVHQSIDEIVQLTAETSSCYFLFSVPRDATPSFSTELLSLRWGLRFCFHAMVGEEKQLKSVEWHTPLKVSVPS
eukprot:jgi/Picsp_1/69/NSC_00069-R1_retrograde golgi transport protein rgp1 homolog